jgi:hypothetical protein
VLGECARASTAEETRFRVDYPNSAPRKIKVVALDEQAEQVVRRLAQRPWSSATFMTRAGAEKSHAVGDWLRNLAGDTLNLLDQVGAADLVVTVSAAGESSEDAAIIAEVCNARGIMLTALLIEAAAVPERLVLKTMMPLRARASMLVVAKGEDYVEAMLTALRA